jgi:uncharacterized protein (DUF2141 family)
MMQHVKLLAIVVALTMASTAPAFAQASAPQPNVLRVQLGGMRSDNGVARCGLFNDSDPSAFPSSGDQAFQHHKSPAIKSGATEIDFTALPPGKYALVCYHDENNNGKFDKSILGMPKEGYCFSNNVKPTLSAPNFGQCAFDYKGGDQPISITMIY